MGLFKKTMHTPGAAEPDASRESDGFSDNIDDGEVDHNARQTVNKAAGVRSVTQRVTTGMGGPSEVVIVTTQAILDAINQQSVDGLIYKGQNNIDDEELDSNYDPDSFTRGN